MSPGQPISGARGTKGRGCGNRAPDHSWLVAEAGVRKGRPPGGPHGTPTAMEEAQPLLEGPPTAEVTGRSTHASSPSHLLNAAPAPTSQTKWEDSGGLENQGSQGRGRE